MKRMHSKGEIEEIINDSELAEQVNEIAAVYEPGKKYKLVACVLRNYNGTWSPITTQDHSTINVASVEQSNDWITLNFGFTAKNVISFVACTDEDFARRGYFIGSSVATDKANIKVYKQVNAGGFVSYNDGEFTRQGGISAVSMADDGTITITHSDTGNTFGRSVIVRNGSYLASVKSIGTTSDQIILLDYSGNVVTSLANGTSFVWSASGQPEYMLPEDVAQDGNIWCLGIMEVE